MIDASKGQLLLGVWSDESALLADGVACAEQRRVGVTTLSVQGCSEECEGAIEPRTLVVVRDRTELLVGQC